MTEGDNRQRRIRKFIHTMTWAVLIIASVMILLPAPDQNALVDFGSCWSAARLLCRGENPYDHDGLVENERAAGWNLTEPVVPWNPPWALAIVIPFSVLSFRYAKWAWFIINSLLILILSDYWWKAYGGAPEYRMASWLAALWFFPCIVAVYFGQMSLLVLSGVTGMAWSLKRGRGGWLGFFVLLASLKPHLLLPLWLFLILWVVRRRSWRTLLWAGSGIAVAAAVVVWFRPEIFQDYFSAASSAHGPVIWATPTIGTALRVAFAGIPGWVVLLPSLCGILITLALWRKWAGGFTWEQHLDMILLISLATASYAWIFDWAILLPAAIRILVWFQLCPGQQWPALIGLMAVMSGFVTAQALGLFPLGVIWFPAGLTLVSVWARRRQDWIVAAGMMPQMTQAS